MQFSPFFQQPFISSTIQKVSLNTFDLHMNSELENATGYRTFSDHFQQMSGCYQLCQDIVSGQRKCL